MADIYQGGKVYFIASKNQYGWAVKKYTWLQEQITTTNAERDAIRKILPVFRLVQPGEVIPGVGKVMSNGRIILDGRGMEVKWRTCTRYLIAVRSGSRLSKYMAS
jgi:hypothetical protein